MKSQAVALIASRGAASLLFALTHIVVAREAQPSSYGVLVAILGIGTVFFVFVDLGCSSMLPRSYARDDWASVSGLLRLNRASAAAGATVGSAILIVMTLSLQAPVVLSLLAVSIAVEKLGDTTLGIAYASRDRVTPAVALMARRGVGAAIVVILVYAVDGSPIAAFVIGHLLGAIVSQCVILERLRPGRLREFQSPPLWSVARTSGHFLVANVSATVRNLDTVLVGLVNGSAAAGSYGATQRLTSPFLLIPGAVATLVLPHAARLDRHSARSTARKLAVAHIALLGALIPTSLASSWIVLSVLGSDYSTAAPIFVAQLIGFPMVALASPLGSILQAQGFEKLVSLNGVTFAVILLVSVLLAAYVGGPVAASWAVAAVYSAKCLSMGVIIERRLA